ncbi:calcium-binding protein [Tropicibacter oceani]|uniref:Calcium-binding protein n=1 Tax=Tropicibacter oceani TaxID=3058420 RepID=A0ABY8QJ49_9RHOB|nr:calcium-binding protein [Tropicibacter oceani]WGW04468.1 calcium-binding protein [Tropicibacter oceani]
MLRRMLWAATLALMPMLAAAQDDRTGEAGTRLYVFGNSLVNHLSEQSDHTNIAHWLNEMAKADGRSFAVDGQWGFLRNFADGLPPTANWSFPGVKGAWSPDTDFAAGRFDAVMITPANFIQYQLPDVPYDGDNPTGESPLGAMLRLTDWIAGQSPGSRIFLYEGWAEMAGVTGGFPPDADALDRYHAFNQGDYHRWYQDLVQGLSQARPDTTVTLIPVAAILSGLMGEGGLLHGLPARAFYVDDAPHGTEALYLLAAMVSYAALYDAPPPSDWRPPARLHPEVVAQYPQIAAAIWQAMPETKARAAAPQPAPEAVAQAAVAADLPARQPVVLPPSGIRPDGNPALGMGLNGIADWSTQHPFVDLMKTARDWVGHADGTWGAFTSEALRAEGHIGPDGWPLSLPEGAEALEAVLLTDQPEQAQHLRGDYVLLYKGKGAIKLTGRAKRVRYDDGQIGFFYEPGEGLVGISITQIDPSDPIRDIHIVKQGNLPLFEAGVIFNPDWIARIEDLRSIRFMDWMMTNGSTITSWQDRPQMTDASWSVWGVPAEVMIRLANQIGADPWFTMPHMADDDYVRNFAALVKAQLDPELKAHVEYSNEVWNFIFPQAGWSAAQAEALWGPSESGWMQFYGLRAAQVMDIWSDVFADEAADRLVRVVSTHTGWPGLEESILMAPLAFLQLGRPPQDSFDAYAVTGYFGYEMGGPEMAQRMNEWLDASEQIATKAGEAQGLRRVALREFVKQARFEAAIAPVTLALEEGSLRELIDEVFPYHAGSARKAGLRLVMYEGGSHVTAHGDQVNDDRLTDFFTAFSYTPEMAKLYELLLSGWVNAGGTLFNAFVDVAPATKWGSWGALRHLDDQNPRWDMLMAFNASAPSDWDPRPPSVFANGITRIADTGNQRLQGTSQDDILIAGPGDDTLVVSGGADVLNGGTGRDRAVLPGARGDYRFDRAGRQLLATGPDGVIRMTGIEELVFEDAITSVFPEAEF